MHVFKRIRVLPEEPINTRAARAALRFFTPYLPSRYRYVGALRGPYNRAMQTVRKGGNQTPSTRKATPRAASKATPRLQTGALGCLRTAEVAAAVAPPAAAPLAEMPGARLDEHLSAVAPPSFAVAVGLPGGVTYGQCLRQSLLRSAITQGDVSRCARVA